MSIRDKSREIDPTSVSPGGWPLSYYYDEDGKRRYTTWLAGSAQEQIRHCDNDRSLLTGMFHLCTSCGSGMKRGVIVDTEKLLSYSDVRYNGMRMNEYDSSYSGAMCYRCAAFAIKHCPWIASIHEQLGDDFPWLVTESAQDFEEVEESGVLVPVGDNPSIRSSEICSDVASGNLYLNDYGHENVPSFTRTKNVVRLSVERVTPQGEPLKMSAADLASIESLRDACERKELPESGSLDHLLYFCEVCCEDTCNGCPDEDEDEED